ncbi:MAG: hypothetical protein K8T26_19590 [Lentisphaerae bacterium]|nr:hypothetical protein [Lentisphaerota bacterium]
MKKLSADEIIKIPPAELIARLKIATDLRYDQAIERAALQNSAPMAIDVDSDSERDRLRKLDELIPVKRRRAICEFIEESYRQLLTAAKEGPLRDKARTALAQQCDEHLRWARNNIAAVGLSCAEEVPLFNRIEALALQHQAALRDIDKTTDPVADRTVPAPAKKRGTKRGRPRLDRTEVKRVSAAIKAARVEGLRGHLQRAADELRMPVDRVRRIHDAERTRLSRLPSTTQKRT